MYPEPKQAHHPESPALRATRRGLEHLRTLQDDAGYWPGDYGGPLFLLPGLLIAYHITGTPVSQPQRERMLTYLGNTQGAEGGWGLHVEDNPTVFGTTLNYVALRILGLAADDTRAQRARRWLLSAGGAEGIPTWGKFWLAVLGVYRWEGVNPLSPELWLLPKQLPMHPGNFWCHTRAVFLPMSYIYGRHLYGPETSLVRQLRDELFDSAWSDVDWPSLRERVASCDLYTPHSPVLKAVNRMLLAYENRPIAALRRRALARVMDMIHHEDETTDYLTIGPVSKPIHMLAVWFEQPDGPAFQRHLQRVEEPYLWDANDGLKMQGYPYGSQCWDTAFTIQATLDSGLAQQEPQLAEMLERAHQFLDDNQVRNDVPDGARYFRDPIEGMWPFSVAKQCWPVSDCTAEGLKAALQMGAHTRHPIGEQRLRLAVDRLLADQNDDGGWSEYERSRGNKHLEWLNAAEVFGDIMIGYSYVECTSACIQGLAAFRAQYPFYRSAEVEQAIRSAQQFIWHKQRPDGSWYGGWGVCFTYGTWFGIEGLRAAGVPASAAPIQRACSFLLAKQHADGGWGESYQSCVQHQWVDRPSQPVQTSWALLALMAGSDAAERVQPSALERAAQWLCEQQQDDGQWLQSTIVGVFNRNCMITYDNYRHIMPVWALGRYARLQQSDLHS